MSIRRKLLCRPRLILLMLALAMGAEGQQIAQYAIDINLRKLDVGTPSEAGCSYGLTVDMPSGSGVAFVPLPFRIPKDIPLIQPDVRSAKQLVLVGGIYPELNYGALAIPLEEQPRRVRVEFAEVVLPVRRYSASGGAAVALFLRQAELQLQSQPRAAIAQPTTIRFAAADFVSSRPAFTQVEGSTARQIDLTKGGERDVLLYLPANEGTTYLFLSFLAPIGILVGLFGAPKVGGTRWPELLALIVTILLLALIIFYFTYFPAPQRYTDTGVILTVGTLAGLLLGMLGASLRGWYLKSYRRGLTLV